MKVLVFEFISGGGFNVQPLPDGLAREGGLMLQALLDNLSSLNDMELAVMLDWRFMDSINTFNADIIIIKPEHDYRQQFLSLAQDCDAVWPIAPESGGVLQQLCQTVADLGKALLTSPAPAVAVAGDKYRSYQQLCQHNIATVPTQLLADSQYTSGEWMVKARDGVGCEDSHIVTDQRDYLSLMANAEKFIIQPHLQGEKTSLSCLFKQGQAWLLSVNLQQFDIIGKQYQLTGIIVNRQTGTGGYQKLIEGIATAMPDLWGYVGVDLIETNGERLVLEINPRLTTSFTAINKALGINVAEQVLRLQQGEPCLQTTQNLAINIKL